MFTEIIKLFTGEVFPLSPRDHDAESVQMGCSRKRTLIEKCLPSLHSIKAPLLKGRSLKSALHSGSSVGEHRVAGGSL